MADQDARMVLRTVYLPPDLDDDLRVQAFRSKQTKNDIIRKAVARWLKIEDTDGLPSAVNLKVKPKSSAKNSKMILRTVYLPPDLDNQLRVQAFRLKQSKNDLIREAVVRWPPNIEEAKSETGVAKPKTPTRVRSRRTAGSSPKAAAAGA